MSQYDVEISAPTRLHFGLVAWGVDPGFTVGGAGVMLDGPRVRIRVCPGPKVAVRDQSSRGIDPERLLGLSQRVLAALRSRDGQVDGITLEILESPQPHVGLGSGTALALALAQGIALAYGVDPLPVETLSQWTGRGKRSGIGLHGFFRGGLIVDGGRREPHQPPPLVMHVQLPESWRIMLVLPDVLPGVHGADEDRVFQALPPPGELLRIRATQLMQDDLVQAVQQADLDHFSAVVEEIQLLVGQTFEDVQGGLYSRSDSAATVGMMRRAGLKSVGQSSWGPILFGFCLDPDRMRTAQDEFLQQAEDAGFSTPWIRVVQPAATGFLVERTAL